MFNCFGKVIPSGRGLCIRGNPIYSEPMGDYGTCMNFESKNKEIMKDETMLMEIAKVKQKLVEIEKELKKPKPKRIPQFSTFREVAEAFNTHVIRDDDIIDFGRERLAVYFNTQFNIMLVPINSNGGSIDIDLRI